MSKNNAVTFLNHVEEKKITIQKNQEEKKESEKEKKNKRIFKTHQQMHANGQ